MYLFLCLHFDITNCDCRNKQNCPLNGKCLESSLVYKAELKTEDDTFNYIGLTEGTIKYRSRNTRLPLSTLTTETTLNSAKKFGN